MILWKRFPKNELYLISNDGQVKSSVRGERLLKGLIKPDGYKMYFLTVEGKFKWFYAHRLVAELFVDNEHSKPEVNHKDGNKANNYYLNLEWMTHKENIKHSYDVLGRKATGRVVGFKTSEETKHKQSLSKLGTNHPKFTGYYVMPDGSKYASSYEAQRSTGIQCRTIYRRCKAGKKGYSFEPILDKSK